jgi:3-phenylpropionate/trans-cinnamate dioxygenase ferredoxin subunit
MSPGDQTAGWSGQSEQPTEYRKALDFAFQLAEQAKPPKARTDRAITVCKASEIPIGGRRIVQDGNISIGVFNIKGQFYAIRNVCPHQGAPLCLGKIHTTYRPSNPQEFEPTLEDRVIRCPWHGWEFDIVSGKGLFDRKSRIATYEVRTDEDDNLVVLF